MRGNILYKTVPKHIPIIIPPIVNLILCNLFFLFIRIFAFPYDCIKIIQKIGITTKSKIQMNIARKIYI